MKLLENLTECEKVVMKCIWDADHDISLVDVMQVLSDRYKKEWKRQTVSTFLLHLIQKQYLTSYRVGRVFYYHPEVALEDYRRQQTAHFLDFWYGNSVSDLESVIDELNIR